MKSISFREVVQGAVRLTAGHRIQARKVASSGDNEKSSEFFQKPLDKPHKVWYNKDVNEGRLSPAG